jgi:hypothetical protein
MNKRLHVGRMLLDALRHPQEMVSVLRLSAAVHHRNAGLQSVPYDIDRIDHFRTSRATA